MTFSCILSITVWLCLMKLQEVIMSLLFCTCINQACCILHINYVWPLLSNRILIWFVQLSCHLSAVPTRRHETDLSTNSFRPHNFNVLMAINKKTYEMTRWLCLKGVYLCMHNCCPLIWILCALNYQQRVMSHSNGLQLTFRCCVCRTWCFLPPVLAE